MYMHIVYQDCEENFCLNGATCQIIAGAYLCICSEGFTGPNCSERILCQGTSVMCSLFLV